MRILIVTPVPEGSTQGNGATARRWRALLSGLGHEAAILREWRGEDGDLLVALHARRSHPSVRRFREAKPGVPLFVAMTGTDLYVDLPDSPEALDSLACADRILVLQKAGIEALPPGVQARARVIHQSARAPRELPEKNPEHFEVCVLAHLRPVKDPLRAALAARLLPPGSRIRVLLVGAALEETMEREARAEEAGNPRFTWLGEKSPEEALRILAGSRLMVLSSRSEGGANVLSEALACGLPILSSRIPGSLGVLGPDHPGYFGFGDTRALAKLMDRAEREASFLRELAEHCERFRPLVDPSLEQRTWQRLLEEGVPRGPEP